MTVNTAWDLDDVSFMLVDATVRAYDEQVSLLDCVDRGSPCCPHPSMSSFVRNPLQPAYSNLPHTDPTTDARGL